MKAVDPCSKSQKKRCRPEAGALASMLPVLPELEWTASQRTGHRPGQRLSALYGPFGPAGSHLRLNLLNSLTLSPEPIGQGRVCLPFCSHTKNNKPYVTKETKRLTKGH